jgi:alpha-beta hydrolase superfamily lysophospholipase
VAGFVLSAPALLVRISRGQARLARLARRIAPRLTRQAGIDARWLSRDPEVVRAYEQDPLVFGDITASLAAGLQETAQRTLVGGADVRVPMLIAHGDADRLCSVEGSRRFHADLTVAGKRLIEYPGLYHEIFNEPEQAVVFRDVLAWITADKPGPSDRSPAPAAGPGR